MSYFILRSGEDGTSIREIGKKELLEELSDPEGQFAGADYLHDIPDSDKGCWSGVSENAVMIIKGEIIVPRPIDIVTKFELP